MKLFELCNIKDNELITLSSKRGAILDDEYKSEKYVVYVVKGKIAVRAISNDGKEILLSVLKENDVFGICNLFLYQELTTLLECKTDCDLKLVSKELLKERILSNPKAMEEYGVLCNQKLQFLLKRIEELSSGSARNKVINYLLGNNQKQKTKEEIASSLGISRATLYREFSKLEKEGLIKLKQAEIIILDKKALKAIVSS